MHVLDTWAPSQYPKRRLFVRSREVSKPRDLYLELSDRSEIWQALRQHCCRCACQISKRYDNLKYRSRGFETLRDLTKDIFSDIETGPCFSQQILHLTTGDFWSRGWRVRISVWISLWSHWRDFRVSFWRSLISTKRHGYVQGRNQKLVNITAMVQRLEYFGSIWLMLWLLMAWRHAPPGNQEPLYSFV